MTLQRGPKQVFKIALFCLLLELGLDLGLFQHIIKCFSTDLAYITLSQTVYTNCLLFYTLASDHEMDFTRSSHVIKQEPQSRYYRSLQKFVGCKVWTIINSINSENVCKYQRICLNCAYKNTKYMFNAMDVFGIF